MKKFLCLMLVCFMIAAMLVGCSGNPNTDDNSNGNEQTDNNNPADNSNQIITQLDWNKVIENTMAELAYDKVDANYAITMTFQYSDDIKDIFEYSTVGNKAKETITYVNNNQEDKRGPNYYSIEDGIVYRCYIMDPNGQEYRIEDKNLSDNAEDGQTIVFFWLDDKGNFFDGVLYESVKNKFDWFEFRDNKYFLKDEYYDEIYKDYGFDAPIVKDMSYTISGGRITEFNLRSEWDDTDSKYPNYTFSFEFENIILN